MSRKMRTTIAKIGICLVLALLACSVTPRPMSTTNSMPGTDFTKYHTYKWVTIEGASHPNQIVDAQIKASIDSQLGAKGLTKSQSDKADLTSTIRSPLVSKDSGTRMEQVWGSGLEVGWLPLPVAR